MRLSPFLAFETLLIVHGPSLGSSSQTYVHAIYLVNDIWTLTLKFQRPGIVLTWKLYECLYELLHFWDSLNSNLAERPTKAISFVVHISGTMRMVFYLRHNIET